MYWRAVVEHSQYYLNVKALSPGAPAGNGREELKNNERVGALRALLTQW